MSPYFLPDWLVERAEAGLINFPTGNLRQGAGVGVTDLFNRILDLLLAFAYPLAFISLAYCAYMLITSMGNPEAYAKTKKNVTYLVIGLFLVIFAAIIVRFFINIFS